MSLLLNTVLETPWAILPGKLAVILAVVARHEAGEKLSPDEVKAQIGAARRPVPANAGGIAVLPLFGTILPRANLMVNTSGAMSAEYFSALFRAALADPAVGAVVLDVDSPGGAVPGIDELSSEIFKARGAKPIVAVANHLAASAAYWIATAADELVVTPSAEAGSIGVFAAHDDLSGLMEREGVKTTLISSGKYKVEGNPFEPLGDEARAAIQSRVNDYYEMFVKAVARNRGVKAADVRNGFGEGRVMGARDAVDYGMADRVETMAQTIERLARALTRSAPKGRSAQAEFDFRRRRARAGAHSL